MSASDEIPKLRMAPRETAEEVAHRYERERRAENLQRETNLENSLAPFRVGSVHYLNAVPLTRGLEDQILFAAPSQLAVKLRAGELDAALVSITEVLQHDTYDILDGVAIASLGEVQSVFLAHRVPLAEIREVYCDTASITGVSLLKVLLAERGLKPKFCQLDNYANAPQRDAVLLIGDRALDFLRANHPHQLFDLGSAWYDLTKLPFVYAVWALRREVENAHLCQLLREAKDFGMDTLDYIILSRSEYDLDFRKDYLTWHIHYHLGSDEKRAVAAFAALLRKHELGPVFDPVYVP